MTLTNSPILEQRVGTMPTPHDECSPALKAYVRSKEEAQADRIKRIKAERVAWLYQQAMQSRCADDASRGETRAQRLEDEARDWEFLIDRIEVLEGLVTTYELHEALGLAAER